MKRSIALDSPPAFDSNLALADVCEFIVDCEHKTAPTEEAGYPSIRTPNIGRGRLILDDVNRVSEEVYRAWTRRAEPREGDLILAREAPVGNVAIVPPGLKVCLGQRTVLIRPDRSKVNERYLVYLLLGRDIQGRIQSMTQGATVAHLNVADIRKLALPPLPDRRVQERIADVLSTYDDLIENNTRRISVLEDTARALYREWFIDFRFLGYERVTTTSSLLGRVPNGWHVGALGEALMVRRGKSYKGTELADEGGMPFVTLKCFVRDGGFRRDGVKRFIGDAKPHQYVRVGDIVMAVTDMTQERRLIARAARIPRLTEPVAVISMDVVKLEPRALPAEYLYAMLRYSSFADEVKKHANGANVLHLNPDRIESFLACTPPATVAEEFARIYRPLLEQADVLALKNDALSMTRNLLLPRLISGEVLLGD